MNAELRGGSSNLEVWVGELFWVDAWYRIVV